MFRRSGSSVPKVLLRLCGEDELRCRGGDAMAMVAWHSRRSYIVTAP